MDKLDVEERQKIASLQKEKRDANSGVGWMYKGDKPDGEEYLLGKRIDKHVEGESDKKEDEASIIFGERIKANIALDVAAKMREDPLFAIRRKEEESRKKLLENPIRMKELQKLISQQEKEKDKREKKSKKHKKKGKKKKKKKQKGDGSSESDSDDDDGDNDSSEETDIMKKYLSILTSKHKGGVEEKAERGRGKGHRGNTRRPDRASDGRASDQRWEEEGRNRHKAREASRDDEREMRRIKNNEKEENYENTRKKENVHHSRGSRGREHSPRQDHREQRTRESPGGDRGGSHRGRETQNRHRASGSPQGRGNGRDKYGGRIDKNERGRLDSTRPNSLKRRNRSSSCEDDEKHRNKVRSESSGDRKQGREEEHKSKKKKKRKKRSSSSSSSSSSSGASSTSNTGKDVKIQRYGLIMSESAEAAAKARKRSRSSSSSPSRHKKHKKEEGTHARAKPVRRHPSPPRKKLTEEEKQRRLAEMMENAVWREDQRESNVRKYREEDKERERRDQEKQSSGFISSLMVEHASSSSVEDRIRRNKYNIQRTRKDLDKNFTQK